MDRTERELINMRDEHLPYELGMLRAAADILNEPAPPMTDKAAQVRRWMAIECFYIHLRAVYSFFFGGQRRRDKRDACATDFFDEPQDWRRRRPKLSRQMREAVELAGTMVAHLSYDRDKRIREGKGLKWLLLARELDIVYQRFQEGLEECGRSPIRGTATVVPEKIEGSVDVGFASDTTTSTTTSEVFTSDFFRDWRSLQGRRGGPNRDDA